MTGKNVTVVSCELFFHSFPTRVPLKFGIEVTTQACVARAETAVRDKSGKLSRGLGETPLSAAWVWPSDLSYEYRLGRLKNFCARLSLVWASCSLSGHPLEIGRQFMDGELRKAWEEENREYEEALKMPWLAALVCNSPFDLALHDAYGICHGISTWESFSPDYMNHDLSSYFTGKYENLFKGRYPAEYLVFNGEGKIPVWHLVGAKDALTEDDLTGDEPDDGYPVLLRDWIIRDGLRCIKIKLGGIDFNWDYRRIVSAGKIALEHGVVWLSTDFNCTVTDPAYVCGILDRLMAEYPDIYKSILYVEQPFPYDIRKHPIDVHSVSARKPLFMDESAHDWELVAFGRELGWSGVALKTCKTLTGAILSLCWAKEFSMTLMVQDLTNPMLAQIPHVSLAAHAGTIMGVESNAMQFYPAVSEDEARIHPGLYKRVDGCLDLCTLGKEGFGYRINEINREARLHGGREKWVKS